MDTNGISLRRLKTFLTNLENKFAKKKHSHIPIEVGLGNVGNYKAVSTVASQELDDAEKSNARANIGAGTSNFDGNYNSLLNKPTIPSVDSALSSTSTNPVQNKVINSALDGKINKNDAGGIATCNGYGKYSYFKIATIRITDGYINRPVVFELSGRGKLLSLLTVMFSSAANTDPSLSTFRTNQENTFWIKKTTTSTWEIYGQYNEVWGGYALHRITGYGANIGVTVNMSNIDALPNECTQASYCGNVNYASSAGSVTWENISNKPSSYSPSSHTHTKSQITDFPSSLPANGGNATTVNGHTVNSNVPSGAKFTDTNTWRPQPDWNATSGDAMIKNKPSLGNASSKTIRTLSTTSASGWKDLSTDQRYVPDMAFMAYWNGAYSGSSSNLAYCNKGAFGTAATKNTGDFATANHSHSNYLTGITKSMVTTALGYTPPTSDTNTWRPVINNLVTTATGSSLDAAQGKVLNDKITTINTSLNNISSEKVNYEFNYHKGEIYFVRIGKYCIVNVKHICVSAISWDSSSVLVPSKFRPKSNYYIEGAYFEVRSNGTLAGYQEGGAKTFFGTGIYECAN